MPASDKYDPYRKPTPYDVLGLKEGLAVNAKDIGKAYNDEKKKARLIKDTAERAQRTAALDRARDELLRPDDRVLLDFFSLSSRLFADLCLHCSGKLAGDLPPQTADLLGGLRSERAYDDLAPADLQSLEQPFQLTEAPDFHLEPHDLERLPLTDIEL
jgi:hypothetical protein